ncbi:hypothetical protein [Streptomyces bobili]|uniref:hypothetical protein n=1 Tax=Streptomyces bobili TaxID=67280 RepID=UPI003F542532
MGPGYPPGEHRHPADAREEPWISRFHPLYEHSGSWASVHVDTSRHTESTPDEPHLTASALVRRLTEQGADEATCSAVRTAVEQPPHSPEPHGRSLFARAGEVVPNPSQARPPGGDTAG